MLFLFVSFFSSSEVQCLYLVLKLTKHYTKEGVFISIKPRFHGQSGSKTKLLLVRGPRHTGLVLL